MKNPYSNAIVWAILMIVLVSGAVYAQGPSVPDRSYQFDGTMSRAVLESYLSRAITMEGMFNGRGDLADNIRMLKRVGAKFIGRSICLWGGEANLLKNLERAREQVPLAHQADPEMILQACLFEVVSTQVNEVPVPDWAFEALGLPVEERNFRYEAIIYPEGQRRNWGNNSSVPDISRTEAKLWFYFLAKSYIDLGFEAIHFGQVEIMNNNDKQNNHWAQVFKLVRAYAAQHARRHMIVCDGHVPTGGLLHGDELLLDFHSFPLRVKEVPDKPMEGILEVGHVDSIFGRSKGGKTFSGWSCEHLPYLGELDNWGVSRTPGKAGAGGFFCWGYDEITWFAHQSRDYRKQWLQYAWDWIRRTDPAGFLQMPGSRTLRSPGDGMRWYYANNPSDKVPDGLGDEDGIKAVWDGDGAKELTSTFSGEKSRWHDGFDRYDFVMDNQTLAIHPIKAPGREGFGVSAPETGQRRCLVIVPRQAAPGNPWLWRGCYWDHEPQTEVELLKRGFHIAFITPDPDQTWDAWYRFLVETHGLAPKPAFIGMSKGGVNSYDWATRNPDQVSCIYADNPAIRPEAFLKLGLLAKKDVPLLNICGNLDFLLERNTLAIENFYRQMNGRITVVIKEGTAHHPHSLRNPKLAADWIEAGMKLGDPVRPEFADASFLKSSYYNLDNRYFYLKEENTYATGRGPGFTPCYDRYDVEIDSQWGVMGMAVIIPMAAAPGRPWVLRTNAIPRDATVDQALLAKGYHIIIPPLTAQPGAVKEQWDKVYQFMTGYGFNSKVILDLKQAYPDAKIRGIYL